MGGKRMAEGEDRVALVAEDDDDLEMDCGPAKNGDMDTSDLGLWIIFSYTKR
jgi:hypothetical protein